ncbi:MAG: hypothetical protein ABFR47_01525 [Verrucomicrobiota bacterium]
MKDRKSMVCLVAALVACFVAVSSASRKDEVTLVMVPREDALVQVGLDIANRYPTLLVSYKVGINEVVSLHGWTGSEWVNIRLEAFQSGKFFKKGPDSSLVIEKAGVPVPEKMLPTPEWCSSASKITTTAMRPLLHLVGQYYDFSFKDWTWFAKRYNLDMDAINPEGLNVAWYHKRMGEHLASREQGATSDLQYWVSLYQPVVVAEPQVPGVVVAAQEESAVVPEEPEEEPMDNLLTNDVPEAVIMSAADAETEELSETTAPAPEEDAAVEDKMEETEATAEDEASTTEKAEETPEEV